ncbi:nickel pincer cofactor biosynthesis protein LarC [bacterium]|jgi:pyridinium-3,5-bisthiocarboxylic acid mononucleotide nickel chelatase|nr:nickel pincer cofactor biosynthesis protein LarC [Planctomicrobium sp.]MDB4793177.1 nickel pincer cofactor biosynthesis protein LarC [bacterium]
MKVAYLDCSTGISGDMTLGALLDVGVDETSIREAVHSLDLPGVELQISEVMQSCFRATHVLVKHPEQHAHRHYSDIVKILDQASSLTPSARSLAQQIFLAVAKAEAKVHGTDVEKIHFHEVGAIDSIVDIVGAAVGFDLLGCDQVHCSPLPTGRGQVLIDHGVCTVPTPGTAELLKGIPLQDVPIEAELTTPTGAAIVKTIVDQFGSLPAMTISDIGYGAGTMKFASRANLLRLFVGELQSAIGTDEVCLLETNLDDVSGEVIGHTQARLFEAGAADVYTIPINMKKNRPAVILSVICSPIDREKLEQIIFDETGTLGIRRQSLWRSTLSRQAHTVVTQFGSILGKVAWQRNGTPAFSPEFDSCSEVATSSGKPLREIYRAATSAFMQDQPELKAEQPLPSQASREDHGSHDHHGHDHDQHSHDSHSHDHDGHTHDHG